MSTRMSTPASEPVLTAKHVSITYEVDPPVDAVRDVSLTLHRGEILGLEHEAVGRRARVAARASVGAQARLHDVPFIPRCCRSARAAACR